MVVSTFFEFQKSILFQQWRTNCIYAYPVNSTATGVVCCCRSAADPELVTCSPEVGTGFLKPGSDPGSFLYEFDGNIYPTFVLDTDYENFGFMYGCIPGPFNTRDELIFIYTRDYHLSSTLETRVRAVAKRNNIAWSNALPIKQGPSVPYTPGPKNCR